MPPENLQENTTFAPRTPAGFARVGIVGAGTMGRGIAAALMWSGSEVQLFDSDAKRVNDAIAALPGLYASRLRRGLLSEGDLSHALSRVTGADRIEGLAACDLVIEAVFEDLGVKQGLFAALHDLCPPETVLATNTSTLDVDEIAAAAPTRTAIGLHFFSPAHVMKLVEVVRLAETGQDVLERASALMLASGKSPIVVGNGPSFVANRMLHRRLREAVLLVADGADPVDVDRVMREFGFPLGPFEISDLAGVDVGWRAREEQRRAGNRLAQPRSWLDLVAERGRHGQKTGIGIYRYAEGSRRPEPDPDLRTLIDEAEGRATARGSAPDDGEMLRRMMYVVVNEGARIIEEGIADTAEDIDAIWRLGYGFPSRKIGPMHWAMNEGLDRVLAAVQARHASSGEPAWDPAPLLIARAASGQRF